VTGKLWYIASNGKLPCSEKYIMEKLMKFGLDVPTTGAYADARVQAQLALEAEAAGWDGFFLWDTLLGSEAIIDPWIALTAIALHTSHIKIGLLALPLPRHRPWLVAGQLANLDQLSSGRMICTVGLGYSESIFTSFGEEGSTLVRAKKLDEGLQILTGLWGNEPFSFEGEYYTVKEVMLHSKPIQSPRIPLWVVGGWTRRASLRRAASFDGACLDGMNIETGEVVHTVEEFRECVAYVRSHRTSDAPFELVMSGETPLDREQGRAMVRPFQEAGATWWIEGGYARSFDAFRERIRSGPPRS
jgi:alkanesulfonate monooxygenase SsuD/methylene tetrahydromethanopterin reductase-like flavin-dependent oxidoreductase (luciferase family)